MPCLPGAKRSRNGNTEFPRKPHLRILITNGRFPVSLDLARQLHAAGHVVYCVDPMEYHVCKFSTAVPQCKQVPAPHENPDGYIQAVKSAIATWDIDMVIPIHEEGYHLAGSGEKEILSRLFAPHFNLLVRLHHKFEFSRLMQNINLDVPEASLCKNMDDVMKLPVDKYPHGMALKPCFGRASAGVYHLLPGEPLPVEIDIGEHKHYVAQEWLVGNRYCSYSVVREGKLEATGLYPVLDTIDGNSSVFFQQRYHAGVYKYIEDFVSRVPTFSGQIAFDFIETNDRISAIECNPRSTSGLHLWSNTPFLARAITGTLPKEEIERPIRPPKKMMGRRESHYQVAAGMLMWEHKNATLKVWASHMQRLVFTRDVIWRWLDPMPTIAQPFLLTEYYRMCRRTGFQLPTLFQLQLIWEPKGEEWERIKAMLKAPLVDVEDEKPPVDASSKIAVEAPRGSWQDGRFLESNDMGDGVKPATDNGESITVAKPSDSHQEEGYFKSKDMGESAIATRPRDSHQEDSDFKSKDMGGDEKPPVSNDDNISKEKLRDIHQEEQGYFKSKEFM